MVCAWQVQGVVAAHTVPAREHINFRMVQHVPDVQHAGDVGWRDDDRKHGSWRVWIRFKQFFLDPKLRPSRFNLFWVVRFGYLSGHSVLVVRLGRSPQNRCKDPHAQGHSRQRSRRYKDRTCQRLLPAGSPVASRVIFEYTGRYSRASIRQKSASPKVSRAGLLPVTGLRKLTPINVIPQEEAFEPRGSIRLSQIRYNMR